MVISYVKQTARRKTEQCKLRRKDKNSLPTSSSFKELLVNKGLKPHLCRVISLLTKNGKSYMSTVQFPHILKALEVKAVQFLGGDCIFVLSWIFSITICITQRQVCFHLLSCIFSIKFVCSQGRTCL